MTDQRKEPALRALRPLEDICSVLQYRAIMISVLVKGIEEEKDELRRYHAVSGLTEIIDQWFLPIVDELGIEWNQQWLRAGGRD